VPAPSVTPRTAAASVDSVASAASAPAEPAADRAVLTWYAGYDEDDADAARDEGGDDLDEDDGGSTVKTDGKSSGTKKKSEDKYTEASSHPAFAVLDTLEGGGEGSEGDDASAGGEAVVEPSGIEGFGGRLAGSLLYGHLLALESLNAQ